MINKSSPYLQEFYNQYYLWLKGNKEVFQFNKQLGLCCNLSNFCKSFYGIDGCSFEDEMKKQFLAAGYDLVHPFNKRTEDYFFEVVKSTCHLNPVRNAWVEARVKDITVPKPSSQTCRVCSGRGFHEADVGQIFECSVCAGSGLESL